MNENELMAGLTAMEAPAAEVVSGNTNQGTEQASAGQEAAAQAAEVTTTQAPAAEQAQPIVPETFADFAKQKGITDEKRVKLLDLIENGGDLNEFIKGISRDIDTIPEVDLLKEMIDERYSQLSPEERADLYEDEKNRYKQDADLYDEAEMRKGSVRLKADLHEFKEKLKQQQMDQAFTKATAQRKAAGTDPNADDIKAYAESLKASDIYKGLSEAGVIQVGNGADAFKMDVDKEAVISYLTDMDAYAKAHSGTDGKPDPAKDLRAAAYAIDPAAFEAKLIAHGRKLERLGLAKDFGNEQGAGTGIAAGAGATNPNSELARMVFG
jgi:hypothetical protein